MTNFSLYRRYFPHSYWKEHYGIQAINYNIISTSIEYYYYYKWAIIYFQKLQRDVNIWMDYLNFYDNSAKQSSCEVNNNIQKISYLITLLTIIYYLIIYYIYKK